jgi:hypothetical protein
VPAAGVPGPSTPRTGRAAGVPNPSRWAISVNRNGFAETGVEVCLPQDGFGGVSSLSAGVGTRGVCRRPLEEEDGKHDRPKEVHPARHLRRCRVLPDVPKRHPEGVRRRDPGRLARARRSAEVPDFVAHPAADAAGRPAAVEGEDRRLLRDRGEAVPAADPAGIPARNHCLGLRPGEGHQPLGSQDLQRAVADDRGELQPAGPHQVDQRARGCERELSASPAARRPDAPLGQPAGRDGGARHEADVHLHARPLYRPRPPGDARSRRRRGRRRERRLYRGSMGSTKPRTSSPRASSPPFGTPNSSAIR